jgi:diacylglycerol kinase family enzyme
MLATCATKKVRWVVHQASGVLRARKVNLVGNDVLPAQADGDPVGWTPISITDAPAAIPVVVDSG